MIYAYHRSTGEIVGFVWSKRDLKTAKKLRKKLAQSGVSYDYICTDIGIVLSPHLKQTITLNWKNNTVGIEGNNCRLRHRIGKAFKEKLAVSLKSLIF